MIKAKIYKPDEEFCLGLYCHRVIMMTEDEEGMIESEEIKTRLVLGFIIFGIDIIF